MMIKNKTFVNVILITLMATFLTFSVGKVMPVYALAELAPEIAPVFDTQIYQLQDYIDHGGMTDPQLDIFYMLCGFYALGQAGSENYQLTDPYSTQDGVLNWLKSLGIETYNTLIGLAPQTIQLPDGSIMSTDMAKRALSLYVSQLMGCALKAVNYDTVQEFEDDINNSENFYIPWNKSTQYGLNTMFQTYGGIYNWQFDTVPFSDPAWYRVNISSSYLSQYESTINSYTNKIHMNCYTSASSQSYSFTNIICDHPDGYNLFFNTSTYKAYICDSHGNIVGGSNIPFMSYVPGDYERLNYSSARTINFYQYSFSSADYPLANLTRSFYENAFNLCRMVVFDATSFQFYGVPLLSELIGQNVYAGDSWANRTQIYNVRSLGFDESDQPYYVTVPDDNNYLLDIRGILQDILNNTNLYNVFINNIYSPDGVLVHDTDLINISLDILQAYEEQNPPIPVNLNDIAELTDNSYLERVKEHARNAGDIFANYVAFWHNCDSDLVYTMFGAAILVLIGAFVGKWGHS